MKYILPFLLFLLFIACDKAPSTTQKMIIGNWKVVTRDTTVRNYSSKRGYEFLNDSICHYKLGFLDFDNYFNKIKNNNKTENYLEYLGTKTKYSLSKDSLKIFDRSRNKWLDYAIKKFTNDTLIIEGIEDDKKRIFTLLKQQYSSNTNKEFDALIVSTSGCFGTCPVSNILIKHSGDIKFLGSFYTKAKGYYTSKITPAKFDEIALRFYQADYFNLKNNYFYHVTDNATVSLVFLKDGKIIKSITDYASAGPSELLWAYIPASHLHQKLNYKKNPVPEYFNTEFLGFNKFMNREKGILYLSEAETFYLLNKLIEGKEVSHSFVEKYKLNFSNDYIKNITTDGRFYKLNFKNGRTKIIDIDSDFLGENNLANSFSKSKK